MESGSQGRISVESQGQRPGRQRSRPTDATDAQYTGTGTSGVGANVRGEEWMQTGEERERCMEIIVCPWTGVDVAAAQLRWQLSTRSCSRVCRGDCLRSMAKARSRGERREAGGVWRLTKQGAATVEAKATGLVESETVESWRFHGGKTTV